MGLLSRFRRNKEMVRISRVVYALDGEVHTIYLSTGDAHKVARSSISKIAKDKPFILISSVFEISKKDLKKENFKRARVLSSRDLRRHGVGAEAAAQEAENAANLYSYVISNKLNENYLPS